MATLSASLAHWAIIARQLGSANDAVLGYGTHVGREKGALRFGELATSHGA